MIKSKYLREIAGDNFEITIDMVKKAEVLELFDRHSELDIDVMRQLQMVAINQQSGQMASTFVFGYGYAAAGALGNMAGSFLDPRCPYCGK